MVGAIILLGIGLVPADPDVATVAVVGALVVSVGAILVARRPAFTVYPQTLVKMLGVAIVLEGFILVSLPLYADFGYQLVLLLLSLIATHATLVESRLRRGEVALVLVGYFAATCWMLASTDVPPIDVILFQQESSAALLQGVNPYELRFDNIFGEGSPYYARELQEGDQLAFGFVYPPLSLLLAVPGYVIAGDYRYGLVAAVTISAALLAFTRPDRIATGAAMLIILAPVTQVVLYWGWTEPFMAVSLAALAVTAARSSASTPVALGLLVAMKQYCAPVLLIGYVLLRSVRRRVGRGQMVLVPLAVALATVVPFAVWNLQALVHSTITVQLLQPFRRDAITIPALLARFDLAPTPPILAFAIGGITLLWLLRWAPRSVAGFCYTTAIVFAVFFLFNKHAFVNYYFFVMVALACGIATTKEFAGDAVPIASEGSMPMPAPSLRP